MFAVSEQWRDLRSSSLCAWDWEQYRSLTAEFRRYSEVCLAKLSSGAAIAIMTETFETTAAGARIDAGIPIWQQGASLNEMAQDLLSRFDLVRSLGLSGASHLFLACERDPERVDSVSPGDQVILKLLAKEAAIDPEQVQLFHLEARAAIQLSHRNIIRVTEAHGVGGLHLCVIERKPNVETLRSRLDRAAWIEIREAVRIIYDIAAALDYAHRNGVVHLNIAPENVLLDGDGAAFVTGFGIPAELGLDGAYRLRSKCLSTQYQSPEQAAGDSVDCRSDLYSAGVLLFEMLTDRTPFNAEDAEAIRQKQMTRQAPSVQLFRPDTPEWVSQVVKRLLERSPGDRFQTAGELLSQLDTFQGRTTDGGTETVGSARPQKASVSDEAAGPRELPGTESSDTVIGMGLEEGREHIPDDIDLVDLAAEGVVELGTGPETAVPLDFLDQEADFFSSECSQLDVFPLRDSFAPPVIEVIGPGVEPPQTAGSGIENVPDSREPATDPEIVDARNEKRGSLLPSEAGARHPKRLVAAFLCVLALATAGYVANIFKPPALSPVSNEDTTRTMAGDTEATNNKPETPSPTEAQSLVVQNESRTARVALRVERRSNKSVKRYARSGWRSGTRGTRPNRRGRR